MLVKCPDCKRRLSSDAATCPDCGAHIDSQSAIADELQRNADGKQWEERRFWAKFWAYGGLAVLMLLWIMGISINDGFIGWIGLIAVIGMMGYGIYLRWTISEVDPRFK